MQAGFAWMVCVKCGHLSNSHILPNVKRPHFIVTAKKLREGKDKMVLALKIQWLYLVGRYDFKVGVAGDFFACLFVWLKNRRRRI